MCVRMHLCMFFISNHFWKLCLCVFSLHHFQQRWRALQSASVPCWWPPLKCVSMRRTQKCCWIYSTVWPVRTPAHPSSDAPGWTAWHELTSKTETPQRYVYMQCIYINSCYRSTERNNYIYLIELWTVVPRESLALPEQVHFIWRLLCFCFTRCFDPVGDTEPWLFLLGNSNIIYSCYISVTSLCALILLMV